MANWHWRNSMKSARFFMFDARAAIPFVLCLLHIRLWTLGLAAVTTVLFYILEQKGLTFDAALRSLRVWIIGKHRPAVLRRSQNILMDDGS